MCETGVLSLLFYDITYCKRSRREQTSNVDYKDRSTLKKSGNALSYGRN